MYLRRVVRFALRGEPPTRADEVPTWAIALPDTPFASLWGDDATRYGSFAAVILAALMPKIAAAAGLVPKP